MDGTDKNYVVTYYWNRNQSCQVIENKKKKKKRETYGREEYVCRRRTIQQSRFRASSPQISRPFLLLGLVASEPNCLQTSRPSICLGYHLPPLMPQTAHFPISVLFLFFIFNKISTLINFFFFIIKYYYKYNISIQIDFCPINTSPNHLHFIGQKENEWMKIKNINAIL